jgi:hypothetical protein
MPFVCSVLDVQLVQPVVCRVVLKWSPGCCSQTGTFDLLTPGILATEIISEDLMLNCASRYFVRSPLTLTVSACNHNCDWPGGPGDSGLRSRLVELASRSRTLPSDLGTLRRPGGNPHDLLPPSALVVVCRRELAHSTVGCSIIARYKGGSCASRLCPDM